MLVQYRGIYPEPLSSDLRNKCSSLQLSSQFVVSLSFEVVFVVYLSIKLMKHGSRPTLDVSWWGRYVPPLVMVRAHRTVDLHDFSSLCHARILACYGTFHIKY